MHVIDQVMSIFAGTRGYLDKVPLERGARLGRRRSCEFMHEQKQADVAEDHRHQDRLDDETAAELEAALARIPRQFTPTDDRSKNRNRMR